MKWPLHPKLDTVIKECRKSKWQHQTHATGLVVKLHPSEKKDFLTRWVHLYKSEFNSFLTSVSWESAASSDCWVAGKYLLVQWKNNILLLVPVLNNESYYIQQWQLIKYKLMKYSWQQTSHLFCLQHYWTWVNYVETPVCSLTIVLGFSPPLKDVNR